MGWGPLAANWAAFHQCPKQHLHLSLLPGCTKSDVLMRSRQATKVQTVAAQWFALLEYLSLFIVAEHCKQPTSTGPFERRAYPAAILAICAHCVWFSDSARAVGVGPRTVRLYMLEAKWLRTVFALTVGLS